MRASRSLIAAFALGLAAHVAVFLLLQPRLQPWFFDRSVSIEQNSYNPLMTDTKAYGNLAGTLLTEGSYTQEGRPLTSHMPGTPMLLALSKRLTGNLGLYGMVQMAVLFVGTLAYARSAALTHGAGVTAAATLLFLTHPLVLFTSWTVNSDALHVGFFLGFLALATRTPGSAARPVGAGGLLGLACYFREVALANAIGASVGLVRRQRPRFRTAALLLGAFLLTLAPWVVRNVLSGAGPVLTTSKAPEIFYICSFGLTLADVNPFDIDEGGALSLTEVNAQAVARLRADGFGPEHPPTNGYFVVTGFKNYLTHPVIQARSFAIKAGNLLRPPIARRHLATLMPAGLAAGIYLGLALQHALLVWLGLWRLARRPPPDGGALRGAFAGTLLVSLAIWTEPRYLIPFYLPLFVLALEAFAGRLRGATSPP